MKLFEVTPDPSDHPIRKDPEYVKKTYYGVANVSDTPCMTFEYQNAGIKALWFPIHEVGNWGYAPFYGVAKFLDNKLASGDERPILLHCHAGANRSVCVAYSNLMALGLNQPEIDEKVGIGEGVPNLFELNIGRGFIPKDVISFLKTRQQHPTYSIFGLLQIINSPNLHLRRENQKTITFKGIAI
jgi:hypothetical protein